MGAFAWVTLATNDSYSLGALVLAHSLKQAGTVHQLAILVTPGVTPTMREKLALVFDLVQEVNILDSRDEANLKLLKRPELGITFTKLHCWRLTQFDKCVFLDADTLVLQNADELFEREELSAAPDVGWPDCFNSGVFVYRPSLDTFGKLIELALDKGSFDGGDQGLLNNYFSDWAHKDISKHLPFIYNMCSTACYSYLPAFKQFGSNAKIIHFIGVQKPWLQYFNTETKKVQPSGDASHLQEVLQRWWDIFCSLIHPHLSPAMQGQSQHGMSPSHFPPQYDPPPNPTASADDSENAWDPWDDYDQKVAQNAHFALTSVHFDSNQYQPIESLNRNASSGADQPSIDVSANQPQVYDAYNVQNNSYYQPKPVEIVYHHSVRVSTPPPVPPPHFVPDQPQHEHPQQSQYKEPTLHHQYHQQQYEPPHREEVQPQYYHQQQHYEPPHREEVHPQYYHHEHHNPHQSNEPDHITYETLPFHVPERPKSPPVCPLLPNECEATTTVSNDMPLTSTIEDKHNEDAGLAGAFSQLTLGVARTPEQDALENVLRKQAWEVGNIDYLGKDSFANIWGKITETLSTGPEYVASAPPAPAESQSQTEKPATEPPKAVESDTEQPKAETVSEPPKTEAPASVPEVSAQPKAEEKPLEEPLVCPLPPKKETISDPASADIPKDATPLEAVKPDVAATPIAEASPVPAATPAPAEVALTPKETPTPITSEATPAAPTEVPAPTQTEASPAPADAQATPAPAQVAPKETSPPTPITPETATAPIETPAPTSAEAAPAPKETPAPPLAETTPTPKETPEPTLVSAEATPTLSTEIPAPVETTLVSAAEEQASVSPNTPNLALTAEKPKAQSNEPPVAVSSPQTKVTEATPPVTPGTPPVEKAKQALSAEASVPDTPPPSEGAATPTPPPRKTDKPKKAAAKPKK